jgi:von Willebrand factor type A domain/Bacterial extracellular solute-binding protein
MLPTVNAQFTQFRKGRTGKQPVSLSSEQALWNYNRKGPAEPAVALYPVEGTLSMDYPLTVTATDAAKKEAARVFEQAMGTEATRNDMRAEGFRTPDGKAPDGFNAELGVNPARPRQLPMPKATEVAGVMQAWAKLTLGLRMLTMIDVSGSMLEPVGPNTNRLQAIAQVAQGGLSMMSDDTELGQWLFSTNLKGNQDWQETVPVGPLGERIGSTTRRQRTLSMFQRMRPKPTGDTGLYDSVLAAYKMMDETYKPEFVNSIVLLTDGKNDDANGPTLQQTLARLKQMQNPNRPILIFMVGYGNGVDRNELQQISSLTGGTTSVAQTPQDIQKIFLQLLSRRISQ